MSVYGAFKAIHIGCAVLTYLLFFVRGVWMLYVPESLDRRWVRILPHVIDTLLLAGGVGLVILTAQYPSTNAWLNAKLIALLLYVALGMIALRRGRSRGVRTTAWIAAQAVFFYIVGVGWTRSPWWGLV